MKPFKCKCGRKFKDKNALNSHMGVLGSRGEKGHGPDKNYIALKKEEQAQCHDAMTEIYGEGWEYWKDI